MIAEFEELLLTNISNFSFSSIECAKLIIQSGIRHVVYYGDKYHDKREFVASRRLLDMAGVSYRYVKDKRSAKDRDREKMKNISDRVNVCSKERKCVCVWGGGLIECIDKSLIYGHVLCALFCDSRDTTQATCAQYENNQH